MRNITRLVLRWNREQRRFLPFTEEGRFYVGPLAFAKGEAAQEVVPTGPWAPQVPLIQQLFSQASQLNAQGPTQYYPGSTVAEAPAALTQSQGDIFNYGTGQGYLSDQASQGALYAAQSAGSNPVAQVAAPLGNDLQRGILGLLGAQGGFNTAGAPANTIGSNIDVNAQLGQSLQGGAMNPYLDQLVAGATRGLNRNLTDVQMPAIRRGAVDAGQPGGTREGIAQGIALSRHGENVGDVVSNIFSNAFNQAQGERGQALNILGQANMQNPQLALQTAQLNEIIRRNTLGSQAEGAQLGTNLLTSGQDATLQQMLGSLGLIPNLQAGGLNALGAANTIGLQQYGQSQAQLDDLVARYFYNQYAPYAQLGQFQNFVTGGYGSSVGG